MDRIVDVSRRSCRGLRTIGIAVLVAATSLDAPTAHAQCATATLEGILAEDVSAYPSALALHRDFAIVGDPASPGPPLENFTGQVLVYRRAGTSWSLLQVLRAPDDDGVCPARRFGISVAIQDDVLVIGDDQAAADGVCGRGAAYIHRLVNGQWVFEQKISRGNNRFGFRVAVDGDAIVVGAAFTSAAGAVFIYREGQDGWAFEQALVAPTPDNSEQFGRSVAVSGDAILVGSLFDDAGGFQDGAAYVYRRLSDLWQFEQLLTAPAAPPYPTWFGHAAALHGDLAVVGDYQGWSGRSSTGAVHVYRHDGRQWNPEQIIVGDRFPAAGHSLGSSIAIDPFDPTRMLVGAIKQSRLYQRTGDQWELTATLVPPPDAPPYPFGGTVALRAGTALTDGAQRAHVFLGLADGDCNGNGAPDDCDIVDGASRDANHDGVPDECPLAGDLDGDLSVGPADLGLLLATWGPCAPNDFPCEAADLDGNGGVDGDDIATLLSAWTAPAVAACGAGDCCASGGGPGCADAACCAGICAVDPYCCLEAWDALCAAAAGPACGCPAPVLCAAGFGDCCIARATPGCGDAVCCEAVCALDGFCCGVAWDGMCQAVAQVQCGCATPPVCNAEAGDCCVEHEGVGCNDLECCEAMCANDSYCCEVAWDFICVLQAASVCDICAP